MRLTQLDTHARILSALALVVVIVVLLAGQQALQAARQNADAVLRELVETQFASLSQAVTDAAILRDHHALQAHLEVPVARGILHYAEYTAPDGQVLRREAGLQRVERPDWFARWPGWNRPTCSRTSSSATPTTATWHCSRRPTCARTFCGTWSPACSSCWRGRSPCSAG